MDAGINNIIYMELYSGPKMANGTCGKTIVTGTIDRGSTVYQLVSPYHSEQLTILYNTHKGGYTLVTLPRTVTPYHESMDGISDHVTYQKLVTR
jgi:hypothetical protein